MILTTPEILESLNRLRAKLDGAQGNPDSPARDHAESLAMLLEANEHDVLAAELRDLAEALAAGRVQFARCLLEELDAVVRNA